MDIIAELTKAKELAGPNGGEPLVALVSNEMADQIHAMVGKEQSAKSLTLLGMELFRSPGVNTGEIRILDRKLFLELTDRGPWL